MLVLDLREDRNRLEHIAIVTTASLPKAIMDVPIGLAVFHLR